MSIELEEAKVKVAKFQKECEEYLVVIVQQKRDADEQQKVSFILVLDVVYTSSRYILISDTETHWRLLRTRIFPDEGKLTSSLKSNHQAYSSYWYFHFSICDIIWVGDGECTRSKKILLLFEEPVSAPCVFSISYNGLLSMVTHIVYWLSFLSILWVLVI